MTGSEMSKSTNIAIMLASALALSVAGPVIAQNAAPVHQHATTAAPADAARPAADNDSEEGLSRDSEDCNKGCIDKN